MRTASISRRCCSRSPTGRRRKHSASGAKGTDREGLVPMQFEQLTAGHGALTAVRTGQKAGEGRDLVVLHSLLADRHAFDPVLPALAAEHRVTLINLPGFHGSQPTPLALMDAYVATIEDGFQEFGIANDSILIGNGFGGTVALAFALAHPERISKLLLSDAAACFRTRGASSLRRWRRKCPKAGLAPSPRSPPSGCFRRPILLRIRRRSRSAKPCCSRSIPRRSRPPARFCRRPTSRRCCTSCTCRRWLCAANSTRRRRRCSTRRSRTRWRALLTWNCRAAAIARRWSSRSSFWRR